MVRSTNRLINRNLVRTLEKGRFLGKEVLFGYVFFDGFMV